MNDGVIEDHGATGGASLEELRHLFVCAEHVETERFVPGVDQLESFLHTAHSQDGQDGPEDLLSHQRVLGCEIRDHGGRQVQVSQVPLPANHNFATTGVQHVVQPLPVALVDNPGHYSSEFRARTQTILTDHLQRSGLV